MIFIDNKYTNIYYSIINRAKSRIISGYTENHHIIPKSLGGNNGKNNIVALTAREHFVCHLLLTKMTHGNARHKMLKAVFFLTGRGKAIERNNVIKSSRLYQKLKEDLAKAVSKQKKGCKQPPRSVETKQRLTASKIGKLNPNFKCEWITPWGVFESSRLAAKCCPEYVSSGTKKNTTPISYLSVCRSKGWIKKEHMGFTPAELGFSINILK